MDKQKLKDEIDKIAISIVDDYHVKVEEGIKPEVYFEQESFMSLRNELIEKMMQYDGIEADDSDSWELMLKYVIRSIPTFKINKTESQKNSFVHYLNSFFAAKHKKMIAARNEGMDITPFLEEKREVDQLVRIISFCKAEGINLENPTDEQLDMLVDRFYKGKEDRKLSEKRDKMLIRLRAAVAFRIIENALPLKRDDYKRESVDPEDQIIRKEVKEEVKVIKNIAYLIEKTIRDQNRSKPERTYSRVKCLYTNEFAKYVRNYTENKQGEEYEKDTPEDKQKRLRANYINDCFYPISEDLYNKLLVMDYLVFTLKDPEPETVYRICMNKYKIDEDGTRSFSQKNIAKFFGTSEETVTNTYKSIFNDVNRDLYEMYKRIVK